ncbi:40S ribosomal protein S8 [Chondrus crispus]|uniref:40S ribosomal protein S8 n=1 Tax=Chondrus crispus TaxID=2769 RepID=R7QGG9_CHOCR|nr:40S ribosomal protein S8 [Chondrus crispus]CDF37189.1 40S ribosomal protein S8 [Chondrus crispus]|eukprot:XP_005717008.1 40S ribosomal protein S8 [Chondrus crispus]
MGISRDSRHKRRLTGGKHPYFRKKRKFELGRQPSMTKLGTKLVRPVRVRGGNLKMRALRLETGNFSWGSEGFSGKSRILNVVYNASNNELVRTNTLVKGCIVQIDATPFRQYYHRHYGIDIGKKKAGEGAGEVISAKRAEKQKKRAEGRLELDQGVADLFQSGRLLASLSSRPGQCGRADGYLLEGKELEFYTRMMQKKKKAGK